MTQNLNRSIFIITALLVFIYLIIRSITVPISHDEAATFFHYIQSHKFVPYYTLWDANNHFLNSLLVYPLYKLFGSDLFWLRFPNLMFFPLYAVFAYKLTIDIKSSLVQLITSIALITAPFLIEFFAQTRGYGLSFALLLGAVYYLNAFIKSKSPWHQFLTLAYIALTVMANMSLMNTFLMIIGGIFLLILFKISKSNSRRNWIVFVIFGLIPFLFATKYALDMKEMRLLYYGLGDGFVPVTVKSLFRFGFNTESMLLAWTATIIGLIASVTLIISFARKHFNVANAGMIAAVFLLGNAIGSILLNLIMEVNFPEDRIAIYFLPLFILTFGFFTDLVSTKYTQFKWAAILLLAFPISMLAQLNLNRTLGWVIYPVSIDAYDYFNAEREKTDTPLIISGDRLLSMSWGYHNVRATEMGVPFAEDWRDTLHLSDYILCHPMNCVKTESDYDLVFEDESNMKIYKRKADLKLTPVFEVDSAQYINDNYEYHNILEITNDSLIKSANILEIEIAVSSPSVPLSTEIIITSSNSKNNKLYYDIVPLKWIQTDWKGQTLRFRRPLAIPVESERLLVYFWNIDKTQQEITVTDIRLFHGQIDK